MSNNALLTGIKVIKNEMLPPYTIMVSPDLWELMKASTFDATFAKACGIVLKREDSEGK